MVFVGGAYPGGSGGGRADRPYQLADEPADRVGRRWLEKPGEFQELSVDDVDPEVRPIRQIIGGCRRVLSQECAAAEGLQRIAGNWDCVVARRVIPSHC